VGLLAAAGTGFVPKPGNRMYILVTPRMTRAGGEPK
jgi:hypothetical protein